MAQTKVKPQFEDPARDTYDLSLLVHLGVYFS